VVKLGGDISDFVPESVRDQIEEKLSPKRLQK
jgi:phosphopantetheine adenylyltransferase